MAKNIASSDTIIVNKPNGNGSNGLMPGTKPVLMIIQPKNHSPLILKKTIEPNFSVIQSANFSAGLRLALALALKLLTKSKRCSMFSSRDNLGLKLEKGLFSIIGLI